jgi:hypothetical protein
VHEALGRVIPKASETDCPGFALEARRVVVVHPDVERAPGEMDGSLAPPTRRLWLTERYAEFTIRGLPKRSRSCWSFSRASSSIMISPVPRQAIS